MSKNKENKKVTALKPDNTAEKTEKRSKGRLFWNILTATFSAVAILISLFALLLQSRSQFYERIFQPLTYSRRELNH